MHYFRPSISSATIQAGGATDRKAESDLQDNIEEEIEHPQSIEDSDNLSEVSEEDSIRVVKVGTSKRKASPKIPQHTTKAKKAKHCLVPRNY